MFPIRVILSRVDFANDIAFGAEVERPIKVGKPTSRIECSVKRHYTIFRVHRSSSPLVDPSDDCRNSRQPFGNCENERSMGINQVCTRSRAQ